MGRRLLPLADRRRGAMNLHLRDLCDMCGAKGERGEDIFQISAFFHASTGVVYV